MLCHTERMMLASVVKVPYVTMTEQRNTTSEMAHERQNTAEELYVIECLNQDCANFEMREWNDPGCIGTAIKRSIIERGTILPPTMSLDTEQRKYLP